MSNLRAELETQLSNWIMTRPSADGAHDIEHIRRVVKNAKGILESHLDADADVVIAASWLHDCVAVAKDSPHRKQASKLAANEAVTFLRSIGFPEQKLSGVAHAIEAHSFSAAIEPQTIEAKIVQDADRLEALGAIGISRCLIVAGSLNRPLYEPDDPFCETRPPNDLIYTIDHFYAKLFKVAETLKTEAGQREGARRRAIMDKFLSDLKSEI